MVVEFLKVQLPLIGEEIEAGGLTPLPAAARPIGSRPDRGPASQAPAHCTDRISLMPSGAEHLFMYLLAVGMSSLGLLKSFGHCLIRLSLTVVLQSNLYILYMISYQIHDLQILPFCGLSSQGLCVICNTKAFILMKFNLFFSLLIKLLVHI